MFLVDCLGENIGLTVVNSKKKRILLAIENRHLDLVTEKEIIFSIFLMDIHRNIADKKY